MFRDGKYYADYMQHGTTSLRLSGDFQQTPRPGGPAGFTVIDEPNIRNALVAPPGMVIVEADYSMLELRLYAWRAREETMLGILRSGGDVHKYTASRVFGLPESEVTKLMRQTGKNTNFALGYGASDRKLAEMMMLAMLPEDIERVCDLLGVRTVQEAASMIHPAWHEAYPAIREWHSEERRFIFEHGYAEAPHGVIRWLPKARSNSQEERAEAFREGINHVIQSPGACMTLMGGVLAQPDILDMGGVGPWNVHDSNIVIVPGPEVAVASRRILLAMEEQVPQMFREQFGMDLTVPILAEAKVGLRWGSLDEQRKEETREEFLARIEHTFA